MLIDHTRQKLINVIIFFLTNTQNCEKLKLLKLLYLFDFEHYAQIDRSVLGLEYFQHSSDILSKKLSKEFECPQDDFKQSFKFTENTVEPIIHFSSEIFTKRELKILQNLSEKYKSLESHEITVNFISMVNDERDDFVRNYLKLDSIS